MSNPLNYPDTVAEAVKAAIEAADLNVHQVAKGAGMPYTTLSRRLAVATENPFTVRELANIAAYLNVPVHTLTAPGVAA